MIKIKKHTGLLLVLMLVVMMGGVFSGCAKKAEVTTVRLNEVVHSIFYAPQYVAIEKDFFGEEGIAIELSVGQGADKSMTALISNAADIGLMGTEAAIYVYNEGKEDYPKCFAQLTQTAGNFLVARAEDKNFDWEDVRGKEIIGGRPGGMPEMVLEYVLRHKGIVPFEDVDILNNLQFTSTSGAFVANTGDYTVEFDPSAYGLEQSGAGHVVASLGTETGRIPYTVYMATQSYLEENAETVQSFTNAIYKGQKWVNEHTAAEIAEVIAPHFAEFSTEDLTVMIERYQAQGTWRDNPAYEQADFELFQDIMDEGGELSARIPFDELIDNTFAQKAIETVK